MANRSLTALPSTSSPLLPQILRVIPERHPSRRYGAELERRFRDAEGIFVQSHPSEVGRRRQLRTQTAHTGSCPSVTGLSHSSRSQRDVKQ